MKQSFVLYAEYLEELNMFTDSQCGLLFKAIMNHVNGKEIEIDDLAVKVSYSHIRRQIDKDIEKYKEVCRKRSEAGKKGNEVRWGNRKISQSDSKQSQNIANIADNDNDDEYENDDVNDNENEDVVTTASALYQTLCKKYGKDFVDERVERGKKYKSTNMQTIARWCEEDKKSKSSFGNERVLDFESIEKKLLERRC